MIKKVVLVGILVGCFSWVNAQVSDTTKKEFDIFYSAPRTYELGGVTVTGIDDWGYDSETLIQLSG